MSRITYSGTQDTLKWCVCVCVCVCSHAPLQVDGEVNPKLQSIHVQDFPISTAHFTRDGTEIVMAGERKTYYMYDMIAGKVTRVHGIRGMYILVCTCVASSNGQSSIFEVFCNLW